MIILIVGLTLFIGVHLLPSAENLRAGLIARLGENAYKGLFSLIAITGLGLIIYGYPLFPLEMAWKPPLTSYHPTMLLVLVGIILFVASAIPSNIQRLVVHPQLIGVSLWAIGHLLVNGSCADVLMFGGLLLFCQFAIVSAICRDKRNQLDKQPVSRDIAVLVVGLVVYVGVMFSHEWLFGIRILPG